MTCTLEEISCAICISYFSTVPKKIQQIIILRKLQIPLKQIRSMMDRNKEETILILETKI